MLHMCTFIVYEVNQTLILFHNNITVGVNLGQKVRNRILWNWFSCTKLNKGVSLLTLWPWCSWWWKLSIQNTEFNPLIISYNSSFDCFLTSILLTSDDRDIGYSLAMWKSIFWSIKKSAISANLSIIRSSNLWKNNQIFFKKWKSK